MAGVVQQLRGRFQPQVSGTTRLCHSACADRCRASFVVDAQRKFACSLPAQLPRRCPCGSKRLRLQASLADALESTETNLNPLTRVEVLSEALPYLQKFHGKTVVIKYGGAAMKDPSLKQRVVDDLVLLYLVGIKPVLVHGGGPEINKWLERVGIEPNFKNGLRVTDEATMEVVEMVLTGKVNKSIVSLINTKTGSQGAGTSAVGMSGKDGKMIRARQINPDLGFVGEVVSVNSGLVQALLEQGCIPVIASVAEDSEGQTLNVNADTAAGELAASLKAEKLILMTDVPGVMVDPKDMSTLVREMTIGETRSLIDDGVISGGMIPKVECCIRSLAQGVAATHIVDGRLQHSLLLELLTDEGTGTMITA